eukprot:NODE_176_length_15869_cov_0.275777.p12 type:complete len:100 gc:universal NODE_176_length_15869_cov_0.275777:3696-3397(-)
MNFTPVEVMFTCFCTSSKNWTDRFAASLFTLSSLVLLSILALATFCMYKSSINDDRASRYGFSLTGRSLCATVVLKLSFSSISIWCFSILPEFTLRSLT